MFRLIIWCKPFARYFLAAWIVAILSVSSVPSIPILKIHTARADIRLDYLIHFCEYGILAFLSFLAFSEKEFRLSGRKWILLTLGLILFATLDEFHQKLIPGRSFNVKDIMSNVLGIIVVCGFCVVVFRIIANRITNREGD